MPVLALDTADPSLSVSDPWLVDRDGAMLHTPSGLRVSPDDGVEVGGEVYRVEPTDIVTDIVLGVGSGGRVDRGTHAPTGAFVAVKTISVESREKREQMLHEFTGLIRAAGCPYVVQWYAGYVDRFTGFVKVVMEYMDMGSLAALSERLNGSGLPWDHTTCVASQVVRGLQHLQSRTMLHRDVKPQNVLHARNGNVKLADFGISKEIQSSLGVLQTFKGTALYMSPERASGHDYSYGSDIWSAGMVTLELATGKHPFPTRNFIDLWSALVQDPEPRLDPAEHPEGLCDFVARCLTRDPSARPDAQELMEHEVVRALSSEGVASFGRFVAELSP